MPPIIAQTIDRMLAHHEPYPMFVMTRTYDVLKTNTAATRVLGGMLLDPSAIGDPPNLMRALFDGRLARAFVVDWERTARQLTRDQFSNGSYSTTSTSLGGSVR